MDLSGKNILVTGGNGLVGSHLVEALIQLGANVICIGRCQNARSYFSSKNLSQKVTLLDMDITDQNRVFELVPKYKIEVIFHLAAQPLVEVAFDDPLSTLKINIAGTYTLLEAARQYGKVKAIVVASSDKAYGKQKVPFVEDMALIGDHPYEASKSCADIIARMYAVSYNLPVTVTRFGNIYGEGDLNFNRIVPGAIEAAIQNKPLEIRSNGKFIREYVYVKDVVSGYILLAQQIEKAKGHAFNISSAEKMTVLDVVQKVGKAIGKKIEVKIINTAKNEIPDQYLDSSKIKKMLGWKSAFSFEEGLKPTIMWYKKYFGVQ